MGRAAARLLSQLGAEVYVVCRRNGRHNALDFPVKQVLYAGFGVKEDLDELAEALPDNIFAMFLCHGIALNSDGSNTMEVQKVNFLGHKYFLEKALNKITDRGSVNIIWILSKRIFVEHAIRFVKRVHILSERYRNRRNCFALRFSLIAGICNFGRFA